MPTYQIEGPEGSQYEVDAPEGASEQEILARVRQEHTSGAANKPAISAKPRTAYQKFVGDPATRMGTRALTAPTEPIADLIGFLRGDTPEQAAAGKQAAQETGQTIAENVVPGTLPEALAHVATGGASKLGQLAIKGVGAVPRLAKAGMRVAGGALGGGTGAAAEGGDVKGEAAKMAALTTLGEGVSGLLGFIGRRLPGYTKFKQGEFNQGVGQAVGSVSPGMGRPKTGDDFARVSTSARGILSGGTTGGTRIGKVMDDADEKIGAALGTKHLEIPMTRDLTVPGPRTPAGPAGVAKGKMSSKYTAKMTYQQAVGELQRLNRAGYIAKGAGRGDIAENAREAAASVRESIVSEVERLGDKSLSRLFDSSRQEYAKGLKMSEIIDRSMVTTTRGPQLDEVKLQQNLFNYRDELLEAFKHDPQGLDRFIKGITRGQKIGSQSLIRRPPLEAEAAAAAGSKYGLWRTLYGKARGSDYLGEKGPSQGARTFLDMLMQRASSGE